MKLKTSISIIIGCSVIFLFIMLPIFLSIEKKEDSYISQFQGSNFSLIDVNNEMITEESFKGPITAIFFGFTNCPDMIRYEQKIFDFPICILKTAPTLLKNTSKGVSSHKTCTSFLVYLPPIEDSSRMIEKFIDIYDEKGRLLC